MQQQNFTGKVPVLFFGSILILLGIVLLVGNLAEINVWRLLWPALIILLGIWLLLRPRLSADWDRLVLLGDIRREGAWQVANQDFAVFVGDVRLNLLNAEIPTGETSIRCSGFVGSVHLTAPENVGVAIVANGFINDVKLFGRKHETFFAPLSLTSENYAAAAKKVRLETAYFINDVRVKTG